MEQLGLVAIVATLVYSTRLAGLTISSDRIPTALVRPLSFVPVAVFTALIIPGLKIAESDFPARTVGLLVAAIVVLAAGRTWMALIAGMASFWTLLGIQHVVPM